MLNFEVQATWTPPQENIHSFGQSHIAKHYPPRTFSRHNRGHGSSNAAWCSRSSCKADCHVQCVHLLYNGAHQRDDLGGGLSKIELVQYSQVCSAAWLLCSPSDVFDFINSWIPGIRRVQIVLPRRLLYATSHQKSCPLLFSSGHVLHPLDGQWKLPPKTKCHQQPLYLLHQLFSVYTPWSCTLKLSDWPS